MESQSTADDAYLELSNDPIRFESLSHVTNVFFDDSKQQVFAIRSGGVASVSGPNQNFSFKMEDKGLVISIKFSHDMSILAIQRTQSSVEFVNYSPVNGLDNIEYSQSCRSKNATIQGFVWTHGNEILLITDHGVELYSVLPAKRSIKAVKSLSLGVNWYVYCPQSYMILLSSGTIGNQMQALHITPGNIHKITKFEMDATAVKPGKLAVSERDVTLAVLYGTPCIIVLRHQHDANKFVSAYVSVYTVHKMLTIKRSHILKLDLRGRFAINVVDNLIIVHHQASKASMIFDIMLNGVSDGTVTHHTSIAESKSIKPYNLKVQGATLSEQVIQPCPLYSENWVVFQPNTIIDIKLGCLWYLELKLESLVKYMNDKIQLVEFLIQRKDAKSILLQVLQTCVNNLPATLIDMPAIFDKINAVYRGHLENEIQSQMGTPLQMTTKNTSLIPDNLSYKLLLDQSDMYTHILSKFSFYYDTIEPKMVIWVLLEYIRSLVEHGIPVQHFIHELVITTLVQRKAYYQLHQLLQYHVVADSKPLACLLLSLENLYPAAHQLALDMLKRLNTANEEIIEVLLSKGYILPALRYVRSSGMADQVSARKFLEAAKATNDPTLYYSVYTFFIQRNLRLHNTTAFTRGEHCQSYVQHFQTLFHDNSTGNSIMNSSISSRE